jgi:hypothetical protein
MVVQAMQKAGTTTDGVKIANALREINYVGVTNTPVNYKTNFLAGQGFTGVSVTNGVIGKAKIFA